MKSVLFLIPSLQARGAERVLVNLANGLDKKRYDVTVQTLFDVGELRPLLSSEVKYLPGLSWLVRGNIHLLKALSPSLAYRLIINRRYDIVVAFLEGAVMRIVSGCPYQDTKRVAWIHGEQKNRKTAAYCYRNELEMVRCYQSFDRIVCVAETLRKELTFLIPEADPQKTVVLYNVNDDTRIRSLGQMPMHDGLIVGKGYAVISVGSLVGVKGFDRLIHVHRRLLDKGIDNHVYIIGKGPEEKSLKALSHNLGVDDSVHLIGHLDNPYMIMSRADIYVCASRQEGFSTAVTESLILGIPVVSTDCSGARELLGNNEFGIVTENSTEGLFDGLYQILKESNNLAFYKRQSSKRGNDFCKEKAVAAVEGLLDSL